MSQSLSQIYVHLIFSTKSRRPILEDEIRENIHDAIRGSLIAAKCRPFIVNSIEDHVHSLFDLSRTSTLSKVVHRIKVATNPLIQAHSPNITDGIWQGGYAAFSVSQSQIDRVIRYIANQREHHSKRSFQDELRSLLELYNVHFDERYLWE